MRIIKLVVLAVWAVSVAVIALSDSSSRVSSQTELTPDQPMVEVRPKTELIDRFDRAIQRRFLDAPSFGMARIMPVNPPVRSGHVGGFSPRDEEERESLLAFGRDKWKVSLHLFGRRAEPKEVKGKQTGKFEIRYRLNDPVSITPELKEKKIPSPKKLLKYVKAAFIDFQTPDSPNYNNYEFRVGDWAYVARPVRVPNQSCLECHTDYVITAKFEDGRYTFRKRKVGDANGVVVYGFKK
jgi:hypothetical protein